MSIEKEVDFNKGIIFLEDLNLGMTKFLKNNVSQKNIAIFAEVLGETATALATSRKRIK